MKKITVCRQTTFQRTKYNQFLPMTSSVRRIRSLIKSCFKGPAWHGPAVLEVIEHLPIDLINQRINDGNSIIELVHHMASWKRFVLKKLEGDPDFDVVGDFNFTRMEQATEADWQAAIDRIKSVHQELMDKLKYTEDAILVEGVPGRSYDFFFLLTGIVNHDLYHLGQIILLKKGGEEQ
ncbi:MAG: DinB family protein [Bacteroidota bacterium]